MKHVTSRTLLLAVALVAGSYFSSCKSKTTEPETTTTVAPESIDTSTVTAPPITVSPDDSLNTGLKDATKDFPGVTATVNNGEVTLAGNVSSRDQLQRVMASVNSLHPKKVTNNIKVGK